MRKLTAVLLGSLGLVLAGGGAYLASLSGSWYFLFAGLGFVASAVGIWKWRNWGLLIFAVTFAATLIWSVWEVKLQWWPLASRIGIPSLFALWLVLPVFRRAWNKQNGRDIRTFPELLTVLTGVALVISAVALFRGADPIKGELPMVQTKGAVDLGPAVKDGEWTAYGRNDFGQRFSPLTQITPQNVSGLKVAWQIQTGDVKQPGDTGEFTYQATPLKIGDLLYLCTPHNRVMALNADTGATVWEFNPGIGPDSQRQHQTCRGVSYLPPADPAIGSVCDARIYLPTADAKLYALDAKTGAKCPDFGTDGSIDLTHNMPFKQHGFYYSTSPPLVAAGKVIVAGAVNDNYNINSPSGVIRAYDARSGELIWNFDSGNPTETKPFDVNDPTQMYSPSSPNSWAVASADEKLGLAYFPMGNRTPDQIGRYRNAAEEKYATSVVALDLTTGEARWVQQFVHHDLWDMDTPAQPSLIDLDTPNGRQPALVVPTKQGDIYVLNRATGSPIMPIREIPAPSGAIPGEWSSKTQPISSLNFRPDPLRESSMWGATLIDQMMCRIAFRKLDYQGQYTPPSLRGTIVYPGNFGVFNWGSLAVDPEHQVAFMMPLKLAFVSQMIPKSKLAKDVKLNAGEQGVNSNEGAEYAVAMRPFLSPLGVPCQAPPWGTVAAVDLRTGKKAYQLVNGTTRDLSPIPVPLEMGVPGIGGPIITKSGVAFLSAATDNNFRAYDLRNGKVLWNVRIPAGGQATPMTYLNSQGEQMVVLVAGGHGSIGSKLGDYVIAYKLAK